MQARWPVPNGLKASGGSAILDADLRSGRAENCVQERLIAREFDR